MAAAPEPLRLFDGDVQPRRRLSRDETAENTPAEESLPAVTEAAKLVGKAQACFIVAVTTARSAGCSWRQIGAAAGVPYQSLHRRFAARPASRKS